MTPPPSDGSSPVPLEVNGLEVRYGERVAVDHLSFSVAPGEIYGLLGSNGAGKTSTIKSVVGLLRPSEGRVRIFGHDPIEEELLAKASTGYVPESPLLYDALTPHEFLEFIANVRQIPSELASHRVDGYAKAFRVEREFDQPLATLSSGTRQKVLLIAALVHHPPLLILDEPFNNLDPRSVRIMKDVLSAYARGGDRGILFSTHTMEIAEQLCHRVGILDAGRLQGEGTLDGLRAVVERGDATLEQIFLTLTKEEEGVRIAVRDLGGQE